MFISDFFVLGKGYLTQREFALKELREESLGFPMGVALSGRTRLPCWQLSSPLSVEAER